MRIYPIEDIRFTREQVELISRVHNSILGHGRVNQTLTKPSNLGYNGGNWSYLITQVRQFMFAVVKDHDKRSTSSHTNAPDYDSCIPTNRRKY